MRLLILRCGDVLPEVSEDLLGRMRENARVELHQLSEVPARRELRFLDEAAKEILPADPTPSLDEISARPDVDHLSTPGPAPQAPHLSERLRLVVLGTDAALSAILTRLMRADHLWAEVAFVPAGGTTAGRNWGLPGTVAEALELAVQGEVRPVPLIRNDAGLAVAGSAMISQWEGEEITGEIIVDNHVLLRHLGGEGTRFDGIFGARIVPMTDAPGIAAVRAVSPVATGVDDQTETAGRRPGLRQRLGTWLVDAVSPQTAQNLSEMSGIGWLLKDASAPVGRLDPESLATGRAVQAGGPSLAVTVDGVTGRRAVERTTFYRHLRDLQIVRP